MNGTGRLRIVIGLLIALVLPFAHLGTLGGHLSGAGLNWGGELLWWALFVIILAYVVFVERKTLSSIGYRTPGVWDVTLGVLAAIVAIVGTGVIFQLVLPALHLSMAHRMTPILTAPLFFRVLLVTRAAFVEETAFRGYGFERLTDLTGSKWLAALVTLILFTLAHYAGGGWAQVIIAAWGGLVLTVLYLWRRNLWANVVCHWLTDGTAFLLLPMIPQHH